MGCVQAQGLMFPVLVIRLCIAISQFTGMNQAFQCLLVPVRLGSTRESFNFSKRGNKGGYITIVRKGIGKAAYTLHALP